MKRRMRRLTAILVSGLAVLASVSIGASTSMAYSPVAQVVYSLPDGAQCNKSPCVIYPKTAELPGGRLVMAFENSIGSVVGQTVPIYKSDDNGDTWQFLSSVRPPAELSSASKFANYTSNWTNPYFYVLPQQLGTLAAGTLLLATVVSGPDIGTNGNMNRTNVAIALFASTNEGSTWSVLDIIATGSDVANDPVWEPYLMMYEGVLVAYYADENDYLGYNASTGVASIDPNNATATDSKGQVLAHRTWTGTGSWSSPVIDVAGDTVNMGGGKTVIGGNRPGMSYVVPTTDGKWLLTYEYFGGGENYYKIATDPLRFFADGNSSGTNVSALSRAPGSGSFPVGSPVTIRTPDGRLVMGGTTSADIWINESGSSTGTWKQFHTTLPGGYSRNMQWITRTGQLQMAQTGFGSGPILAAHLDIGRSAGTYYSVVNRKTGQILSTDADKTQDAEFTGNVPDLISWTNNPSNRTQGWQTVQKGTYVTFLNQAGGRSMGIWGGAGNAGARVAQWVDDGGIDKQWTLVVTTDGYVRIQSRANPSLYLTGTDAFGAVTVETAINASTSAALDDSQEWKLVTR